MELQRILTTLATVAAMYGCAGMQPVSERPRPMERETIDDVRVSYNANGFAMRATYPDGEKIAFLRLGCEGRTHLIVGNIEIFDENGDGSVDRYLTRREKSPVITADTQCAPGSDLHERVQSVYDNHLRHLDESRARENWTERWSSCER